MAYLLMWIEALAAALLFVAMLMSLGWRSPTVPGRDFSVFYWVKKIRFLPRSLQLVILGAGLAAPILVPIIGIIVFICIIRLRIQFVSSSFLMDISIWAVAFVIGVAIIVKKGARTTTGDNPLRKAINWPRAKLAITFSATVILLTLTFWNTDSAAQAQLVSLRAEASTLALSVAPPRAPDRDNAAIFYEKAFEVMPSRSDMPKEWELKLPKWASGFREHFDTADKDFRDYMARHRDTLSYLRKAATMPSCYFEHDYVQPSSDMSLPELSKMRHCARLLTVVARMRVADGDVKGAIEDIAAIFSLSAHVSQSPIMISYLVALAINRIGKSAMEGLLTVATPTIDDLALLKLDDNRSWRYMARRSLIYEKAWGLSAFSMHEKMFTDFKWFSYCVPLYRVFLMSDDLIAYRKIMEQVYKLFQCPYYEVKEKWRMVESETMRGGPICQMIILCQSRFGIMLINRTDTAYQLTRLAVAATLYRIKTGKYPVKLEDLTPDYICAIPIDPFDGKPLKMATRDQGIILYGADENGASLPQKLTQEDDWRIFRLGVAKSANEF